MIHKPFTYQVRPVQGPGSPGELFVEGERFNIQRFYENQTSGFYMGLGRMFTPDVPFDPFSVRNLLMAVPGLDDESLDSHPAGTAIPLRFLCRSRPRVPPRLDKRSQPTPRTSRRS